MKLLIEIPEEYYKTLHNIPDAISTADMLLIKYGTLLPEHHGRLIDADVLIDGMEDDYEFCEAVNATPTIIPATKEKSCKNCKYGKAYEHGADITTMDDECGGCCSWNDKWTPKTDRNERR